MSARQPTGGTVDHRANAAQYSTRADSQFDEREIAAWVFISLCAVSPLLVAVLCLSVIRLFS